MAISKISGTIASGATNSSEFKLNTTLPCGIFMDQTMTGTVLTFLGSPAPGGPYGLISDGSGGSYSKTFRSGDYVPLDPATFAGLFALQVVSNASEGALRNLQLMTITN
jgi:hypothetical protein